MNKKSSEKEKELNKMKMNLPEKEFIETCRLITNCQDNKQKLNQSPSSD